MTTVQITKNVLVINVRMFCVTLLVVPSLHAWCLITLVLVFAPVDLSRIQTLTDVVRYCICKLGLRICKFSNLYAVFISVECFTDADCYPEKSCVNKECVPVTCDVACGNNAACTIANHVGSCQCNTGYVADPDPETRCGMCKLRKLYFYHY